MHCNIIIVVSTAFPQVATVPEQSQSPSGQALSLAEVREGVQEQSFLQRIPRTACFVAPSLMDNLWCM